MFFKKAIIFEKLPLYIYEVYNTLYKTRKVSKMTTGFLSQTAKSKPSLQTATNMQDGGNGRYLGSRRRKSRNTAASELPDYSYLLTQKDPRMKFDKDPIYCAFDVIDNASFKTIVKKFFRGEL